jgi:putative oxidoreductase
MVSIDIASVILRAVVGVTMFAHGYRHIWGGGKLPGTARWFESIGIRPGKVHALLASVTELGAAVLLWLGLLTPLGAAGVLGTMSVALIANHLRNGFFIFRPGEGYEYVLNLCCVALALGALGGGRVSLDNAIGIDLNGWGGFFVTLGAGGGGALLLLATCWRPGRVPAKSS